MNNLIIKNGIVFDPLNGIEGEVKDILIEDGKIVESISNKKDVKEINASGKTVIPAAIDIHAHIASQQVNWARLLGKNNEIFQKVWKGLTLENIAKDYISNGYTMIVEANVFPSLTKQTIFNFNNLPVLDKAMLLNVSNLWSLELEYQRGKIDDMAIFLSDLLEKTKGFGFKVYNPFESEDWDFKVLRDDLSKQGRLYNFNALDVYENISKSNEELGLPHSVHAHVEGYEDPQGNINLLKILEKIKSLNLKNPDNRSQIFHLAHASSYNINGDNSNLIKFFNDNQNFDLDLGILGFNEINPIISSDRRLINSLIKSKNPHKLIRSAIEFEGDLFSSIRKFDKNNEKDCNLWANAIDLVLNIKNKYQIQASINFPNYANITDIPKIATLFVSSEARNNFIKRMNVDFLNKTTLKDNDKTITFNELIIITRASPAKSLGLRKVKGNLDIGVDGDVNILNFNALELDLNKDYEILKEKLKNIEYVIKEGEIIKHQDHIIFNNIGKIFWSSGKSQKKDNELVLSKKKEFYKKYSSIFYDSFKITINSKLLKKI
ncbi:MAG: amidohydrolase family protein [Promethearchaeota archaeon]